MTHRIATSLLAACGFAVFGAAGWAQDEAAEAAAEAAETVAAAAEDAGDAGADAALHPLVTPEAVAEYAALTGDPSTGQRVFRQCMACHTVDAGVNRVGPSLFDIVGREAGQVERFRYTPANADSGVTWTEETLFVYLENPREFMEGTRMIFAGVKDAQQRADLIAYLKEQVE